MGSFDLFRRPKQVSPDGQVPNSAQEGKLGSEAEPDHEFIRLSFKMANDPTAIRSSPAIGRVSNGQF